MSSISDKLGIPNIIVLEKTGPLVVVQKCDIDSLKKQRDEMLEALIEAVLEELETINSIGGCDHSVNVCCCHEIKLVEKHISVIENLYLILKVDGQKSRSLLNEGTNTKTKI